MNGTTVSIETIAPEQAQHWLSNFTFDGQRSVRRNHVRYLASEMKNGRFKQGTLIVFGVDAKGKHHLLDGQHRLSAVVESGTTQSFIVSREPYVNGDMKRAYVTIDQGAKRTVIDKYGVYGLTEKYGMTKTQLNFFGAAVRMIESGFSNSRVFVHDEQLLAAMDEYSEAGLEFYEEMLGIGAYHKHMVRAATFSIGIVTMKYGERDKTSDYWYGVATGEMLAIKDPRKMAREHLLTTNMNGAALVGTPVKPAYSARYLAMTYNLFMQDRPSSSARLSRIEPSKPINIYGSPFHGDGNQQ